MINKKLFSGFSIVVLAISCGCSPRDESWERSDLKANLLVLWSEVGIEPITDAEMLAHNKSSRDYDYQFWAIRFHSEVTLPKGVDVMKSGRDFDLKDSVELLNKLAKLDVVYALSSLIAKWDYEGATVTVTIINGDGCRYMMIEKLRAGP